MRKLISTQALCFVICMLALFNLPSCKKSSSAPINNNQFSASVIVSPTQTLSFQFNGDKAHIGCPTIGPGPTIWGESDASAMVVIGIRNPGGSCVTTTGTYPITCEYRKNNSNMTDPIFSNFGKPAGTINFTSNNGDMVEGNFQAIAWCASTGCVSGVDSVIVSGTFKGNILR